MKDLKTKEKIGWGILGPGRIAYQFCDGLEELPDAYVAAVGSRSIERSRELSDVYGGTPYGSYQEMVNDPNVDIVYVATPHPMHEEHVIMAANAGKHVLCEKPFAVNRQQAENMFEAGRRNNVFVMEGLWSRFFPAWQYVREELDSGRFGKVEMIYAATGWGMLREGPKDLTNRLLDPNLAGGSLLDAGIYSLAAMSRTRGRFDMPAKILSNMKFVPETGVDSDVDMLLEFEEGFTAHISCSLHRRDMEAKIICQYATIIIPNNRNPSKIIVQERAGSNAQIRAQRQQQQQKPARARRDYYGDMRGLPLSQRRMGSTDTTTMEFPYRKQGFQFEAEIVQDCLRQGLTYCPQATPEETLMLISICDEARRAANFVYPFEM